MLIENSLHKKKYTIMLSRVTPGRMRSLKVGVTTYGILFFFVPLKTKNIFEVPAYIISSP